MPSSPAAASEPATTGEPGVDARVVRAVSAEGSAKAVRHRRGATGLVEDAREAGPLPS